MQSSTLTLHQAADLMNVHINTVTKLIISGDLPAAKIGRAYVILYKDAMDYIERMVIRQTAQRQTGGPVPKRQYRRSRLQTPIR